MSYPGPVEQAETREGQPSSLADIALALDIAGLVRLVRSSTIDELSHARDAAKTMRRFAAAFGRFNERRVGRPQAFVWRTAGAASDLALACAIPGIVWLRRAFGPRFDNTIAFLCKWTPFFEATNTLLDQLPDDLAAITARGDHEALTADVRPTPDGASPKQFHASKRSSRRRADDRKVAKPSLLTRLEQTRKRSIRMAE